MTEAEQAAERAWRDKVAEVGTRDEKEWAAFFAKSDAESASFQTKLLDAYSRQMQFVNDNREALIKAWVAETGCLPSESELVEQRHGDGTTTVHVRRLAVNGVAELGEPCLKRDLFGTFVEEIEASDRLAEESRKQWEEFTVKVAAQLLDTARAMIGGGGLSSGSSVQSAGASGGVGEGGWQASYEKHGIGPLRASSTFTIKATAKPCDFEPNPHAAGCYCVTCTFPVNRSRRPAGLCLNEFHGGLRICWINDAGETFKVGDCDTPEIPFAVFVSRAK